MNDPRHDDPPPGHETQLRREAANTGAFILSAVIWALLSGGLTLGLGLVGGALGNGSNVAIGVGVAVAIALLGFGLRGFRRSGDPRRRGAKTAGALTGIGVGLLLVGGCFVWLSNLQL